jgi:hypothetical protein
MAGQRSGRAVVYAGPRALILSKLRELPSLKLEECLVGKEYFAGRLIMIM